MQELDLGMEFWYILQGASASVAKGADHYYTFRTRLFERAFSNEAGAGA